MSGWGWFFLILLLILLGYGGFVGYRIFKARKNGEPIGDWKAFVPFMKSQSSTNYPTPRSSGPIDWVKDKIAGFQNKRTTQGGYEESRGVDVEGGGYSGLNAAAGGGGAGAGRRGRGHEDDAWDSRVGNEDPYGHGPGGYYEEQELGLAPTPGLSSQPDCGTDYMAQSTEYGGSSVQRGRPNDSRLDPFGDQHEASSLRSVSPRPDLDTSRGHTKGKASLDSVGSGDGNTSPISTRKSAFREGI